MNQGKVMIIDDEKNFADLLKLHLEFYGYQVLALTDTGNVIYELHNFMPDIILLDLLMPEYGGLDICQMLNKDDIGSSIPVIVVSGLDKEDDKKSAYRLGIEEYFVKPVDTNKLIAAIEKIIKRKNKADGN